MQVGNINSLLVHFFYIQPSAAISAVGWATLTVPPLALSLSAMAWGTSTALETAREVWQAADSCLCCNYTICIIRYSHWTKMSAMFVVYYR